MVISRLVLKLGLVRFATSFLVVLLANVLNRVLIVDLTVPAALVTFSFAFQHVMTPVGLVTGYFSDTHPLRGRHRSPYIWGGMLLSVAVMPFLPGAGLWTWEPSPTAAPSCTRGCCCFPCSASAPPCPPPPSTPSWWTGFRNGTGAAP